MCGDRKREHFEVEKDGKCVYAHEIEQYKMGENPTDTAKNIKAMLEEYYQNPEVMTRNFPDSSGEDSAFREGMRNKIRNAISSKSSSFNIGLIGNSVMAGHDNCHLDHFGSVFQRLLAPLFKQLGMEVSKI